MKILNILLLLISSSIYAQAGASEQCYANLTNGYQDSALFTQHSSYVYSNSAEMLDEKMAYNALAKTLKEQDCKIELSIEDIKCTVALNTILCRADLRVGYFLILKDYVDTVNLIFNRWD